MDKWKSQHTREYDRFVAALRAARERAGLTQSDVAKKLRTYASFVSKCEAGERRLDVVELKRLCAVYGVGLVDLLREAGLVE